MKKNSTVVNGHVLAGPALLFSQILIVLGMFVGLTVEAFKGLKRYALIDTGKDMACGTKQRAVTPSGKISGTLPAREFHS